MIERVKSIDQIPRAQLEALADEFFREARAGGKFDYAIFRKSFEVMASMELAAMWLIWDQGVVVGALSGMLFPETFTGDLVAVENFWFVTLGSRGGRDALRALHMFEDWAINSGAVRIIVACMEAISPVRMGELYGKLGYRALETMYVREVNK